MPSWTVDGPTSLDVDGPTSLDFGEVMAVNAPGDEQMRPRSASGAVRSEFDSLRTVRAPASHAASGNVGAGTGRVSVTTASGAVPLLRAPAEMESKSR